VVKKSAGRVLFKQSKTFDRKALAVDWARRLELHIQQPGAVAALGRARVSVGALFKRYSDEYGALSEFGRTKRATLAAMQNSSLAELDALALTTGQITDYIKERRQFAGPATVAQDITWLRLVFQQGPAWDLPLPVAAIDEAARLARQQKLIGKAKRRNRRPTARELALLNEHFTRRDDRADLPMRDIMWFAIHSCRRQAEITRLEWADNRDGTGLVRDLKHPREKKGNHKRFRYTAEALAIAQRQPATNAAIFPYNARSISAAFTRACHILEIADLRFHDLRHEGVSRLFEAGYSIVEVQQFSLHESWQMLQRYTNLRAEDVELKE